MCQGWIFLRYFVYLASQKQDPTSTYMSQKRSTVSSSAILNTENFCTLAGPKLWHRLTVDLSLRPITTEVPVRFYRGHTKLLCKYGGPRFPWSHAVSIIFLSVWFQSHWVVRPTTCPVPLPAAQTSRRWQPVHAVVQRERRENHRGGGRCTRRSLSCRREILVKFLQLLFWGVVLMTWLWGLGSTP